MCFFSKPKTPSLPPAPPPVPAAPSAAERQPMRSDAATGVAQRLAASKSGTILTGALGLNNGADTRRKTLLGQ